MSYRTYYKQVTLHNAARLVIARVVTAADRMKAYADHDACAPLMVDHGAKQVGFAVWYYDERGDGYSESLVDVFESSADAVRVCTEMNESAYDGEEYRVCAQYIWPRGSV